jgi:hypothetical protein
MNNHFKTNPSSFVTGFPHISIESRRRKQNAFLFFLCFLLPSLSMADQAEFEYSTSDGVSIVTGYSGPGGAVVVPNELGGKPVRGIADNAFSGS